MSAYRFPVYLLGLPGETLDRLLTISSWCVLHAGIDAIEADVDEAEDDYNAKIEAGEAAGGAAKTWESATREHRVVVVGQSKIGQYSGTVEVYMRRSNVGQSWADSMTKRFGPSSLVSVGGGLLWEQIHQIRNGTPASLDWRQFATLCAVNCAIGDKKVPFRVTRDFIRAASIGFKSGKGYFLPDGKVSPKGESELKKCRNDLVFSTVQQVRDDLDQLENQGLIGRLVMNRRATAYYRPDVCPRKDALAWLEKAGARQQSIGKLRNEERQILETTRKNHSEPLRNR